MDNTCPFCTIDKEKTRIIEKGKHTLVFLSNPRLMRGHLLVAPIKHREKLSQLTKKEILELLQMLVKYEEKILKKLAPGCDIRQNYRPFIPQGKVKVNHLHFHLQPRSNKDAVYKKSQIKENELFKDLAKEEIKSLVKLLK